MCVWHHPQRGACSGDFWTHTSQVSEKWKLCLLCLCLSCCFCLFSFFGDPILSGLSVYLLLYSHSGRRRLRRRCCLAAAATAAVGITKSLNQLLTTGRVSLPKQQQQQKVSQVADWASNEVICRRLRQTAACVIPLSNPGLVAQTEL